MEKSKILKAAFAFIASTMLVGAMAIFSPDTVAHATHNLWRCSRCGSQIQTNSSYKPAPGTCAYSSNGHDWHFVP